MDTKTNERILKILLEVKNDADCVENPILIILDRCNDLDKTLIKATLSDLDDLNLITVNYVEETIDFVGISLRAISYFREKKEQKRDAIMKWLWDTFKWLTTCLIPLLVGYYMGKH